MIKKEIDVAFETRSTLKTTLEKRKESILRNFGTGKEVELELINMRSDLIHNFNLDFFISSGDGNYFINQKFASEQLPFHKSGNSIHLGRFDDISLEMATYKRNPNILNRYHDAYAIDGRKFASLKKPGQNGGSSVSDIVVDKNFKETAMELFGERIEKNLVNIYGMLGAEQTNIIKKYRSDKSMWVNGFAGTGKTVIGLEIFLKGFVPGRSSAIFANDEAAVKANEFLSEVNHKQVATTYREMENKLRGKVLKNFEYLNEKASSLPFISDENIINITFGDDKFELKTIDPRLLEMRFNGDEESKVKLLKKVIEIYGPDPKLLRKRAIENIFFSIRDYAVKAKSLIEDGAYISDLEENGRVSGLIGDLGFSFIFLDEAPILLSTPYLAYKIRELTINDGLKMIAAFDEFQYYEEDLNEIWKYLHYDIKGTLNTVYRTTKEIFAYASKGYITKRWEAPVSINDSLVDGIELNKTIKLSWAIENYDKLIGLEFKELTIIEDIDPSLVEEHILYMVRTRAVRKLSIIKGDK